MTALAFALLLNSLPWCGSDRDAPCCIVEWVSDGWRQRQVMRRLPPRDGEDLIDVMTEPGQCLASELRT